MKPEINTHKEYKVGDIVQLKDITKGKPTNWANNMNKYSKMKVIITKINSPYFEFKEGDTWTWTLHDHIDHKFDIIINDYEIY